VPCEIVRSVEGAGFATFWMGEHVVLFDDFPAQTAAG